MQRTWELLSDLVGSSYYLHKNIDTRNKSLYSN